MVTRVRPVDQLARRSLRLGFVVLLALMPFFAFSYVWLNQLVGHLQLLKIWPEVVITGLALPAVWLFVRDRAMRRELCARKINWLALTYIVLHVVVAVWQRPEARALIAGLMINLRLMALLLLGQVLAYFWSDKATARAVKLAVLVPAVITTTFGVLEAVILPKDFLRHFGYGADTIRPYTTLHQGSGVLRYSSTLRGPNPFGAYVVLVISLVLSQLERAKQKLGWWVALAISVGALIVTYSRSAWLAAVVMVLSFCYWQAKPQRRRQGLVVVGVVALLVVGLAVKLQKNTVVQNGLFHTDQTNIASTSDSGHLAAVKSAVQDIADHPLGSGPGTAGPASVNLKHHPAKLAENYYLQVAQEVGVFGLVLFLLIYGLILARLFRRRQFGWPRALLFAGIGLAVANLLLHVWADDTLGIIWWGLAGYFAYLPDKTLKA